LKHCYLFCFRISRRYEAKNVSRQKISPFFKSIIDIKPEFIHSVSNERQNADIRPAGDLGVLIEYGDSQQGSVLQRREGWFSDVWRGNWGH